MNNQPISENPAPIKGNFLSGLGMTASMACAVHCAITPFVLAFLPVSGGALEHSGFHALEPLMIAIGAGLSLYFLFKSGKKSKFFNTRLAMILTGLGILLFSAFLEGEIIHPALSFSGAILLAASQFRPLFREKHLQCADANCKH